MRTSLFEIFKIGIGPSSSHTVGPMRAAQDFASALEHEGHLRRVRRICAELFGSLALTGKGHGSDRALVLGLCGELPDHVDPATIDARIAAIRTSGMLPLNGTHSIAFDETPGIVFHKDTTLEAHSNGMRFTAYGAGEIELMSRVYYSIGGGFIRREGEDSAAGERAPVPHPFASAAELLQLGDDLSWPIWRIAFENEKAWHTEAEIRGYVDAIWSVMRACVERGLVTQGTLPGGLEVRRRAPNLAAKLDGAGTDPLAPMDWVNVFAMAVSEENAAGGRVVTAPTNGAAGIIPAVAHYYTRFVPGATAEGLFHYFLTAAAIGILYQENASISGAEVGCQGEVGVACSMAAGALVAALGGTNHQVEYAAEIAMEHKLGMTCDPIGGLVQIPCIERNAIAAVEAINAARIAMHESGEHKVSLDNVIQTMYQTGIDMQRQYKETSLGGLAVYVIKC